MLSAVLPWLILAALILLPVMLRIWGEPDHHPDNGTVHHSDEDDEPPEDGRPGLMAA